MALEDKAIIERIYTCVTDVLMYIHIGTHGTYSNAHIADLLSASTSAH